MNRKTIPDQHSLWLDKAKILVQALPYMQKYRKRYILIKAGGQNLRCEERMRTLARDVILLQQVGAYPILVHGGGTQVDDLLTKLAIPSRFVNGMRVTSQATMDVVEMVLSQLNKKIVASIGTLNGKAVGLSGKDSRTITAEKLVLADEIDLGFVGRPARIDTALIISLCSGGFIPVIAPVACDDAGNTFNINADLVAGELAVALPAKRLLYLSDVSGVYDSNKVLIRRLTLADARSLLDSSVITGGMRPKLNTCMDAVSRGVSSAVILDGLVSHIVLMELFTDLGAGTLITS